MKITRTMDRKESLKAFIVADRKEYYDRNANVWLPFISNTTADPTDRIKYALKLLTRKHCNEGMYYLPPSETSTSSSLSEMVRKHFKEENDSINALNKQERLDLAFSVFRYLSRCLRLGSILCKEKEKEHNTGEKLDNTPTTNKLQPTEMISSGCLLISHPLLYQSSLAQGVLLIVNHTERDGSLGVLINNPSDVTYGTIVTDELLMEKPYLKELADCHLHLGGDVMG